MLLFSEKSLFSHSSFSQVLMIDPVKFGEKLSVMCSDKYLQFSVPNKNDNV